MHVAQEIIQALCYIQCICVLICRCSRLINASQRADIFVAERHNDFGKHIYGLENPKENTVEFLKILYIYLIGYFSATSVVKLAM